MSSAPDTLQDLQAIFYHLFLVSATRGRFFIYSELLFILTREVEMHYPYIWDHSIQLINDQVTIIVNSLLSTERTAALESKSVTITLTLGSKYHILCFNNANFSTLLCFSENKIKRTIKQSTFQAVEAVKLTICVALILSWTLWLVFTS